LVHWYGVSIAWAQPTAKWLYAAGPPKWSYWTSGYTIELVARQPLGWCDPPRPCDPATSAGSTG